MLTPFHKYHNPHLSSLGENGGQGQGQSPTSGDTIACPKCGVNAKSGKKSCCAPGGSWFPNCGDPGDTRFVHTWTEGAKACRSKCMMHWI